jgi:hypothetical protein
VNVAREQLERRLRQEADAIIERGDDFEGLALGSFTSLDAATRLVNSTISLNRAAVDRVVRGEDAYAILGSRFGSVTGFELHLPRYHAEAYHRDTYGVRVFIVRDTHAEKGYRVQSAFPVH